MTGHGKTAGTGEGESDGEERDALYQLGYVSTQVRSLSSAELLKLLREARERNLDGNITGLLLHRRDSFFQVIEGAEYQVRRLLASIAADPRHHRLEVMFEGPIEAREFSDWQMGFLDLDNVDLRLVPGFSNFLHEDADPRRYLTELSRSKRLALLFRSMA